jgi:hypothetical protein
MDRDDDLEEEIDWESIAIQLDEESGREGEEFRGRIRGGGDGHGHGDGDAAAGYFSPFSMPFSTSTCLRSPESSVEL